MVPHLPIGPHRTKVGPGLVYQPTGEEAYGVLDIPTLANQLLVHHAAHACGNGDVYFGVYPMAEMVRDGGDFNAINLGGQGAGQYAIGPS